MSDTSQACFGEMFPNLDTADYNRDCTGALFTVQVSSAGVGPQARRISMDSAKLKECMTCPRYRFCYDLSMAKLAVHAAMNARF